MPTAPDDYAIFLSPLPKDRLRRTLHKPWPFGVHSTLDDHGLWKVLRGQFFGGGAKSSVFPRISKLPVKNGSTSGSASRRVIGIPENF